jgi:uncharacterized membrane protein YidH (DUF202 family)
MNPVTLFWLLFVNAVGALLLMLALRYGHIWSNLSWTGYRRIDRHRNPIAFWFSLAMVLAAVILANAIIVRDLFE